MPASYEARRTFELLKDLGEQLRAVELHLRRGASVAETIDDERFTFVLDEIALLSAQVGTVKARLKVAGYAMGG